MNIVINRVNISRDNKDRKVITLTEVLYSTTPFLDVLDFIGEEYELGMNGLNYISTVGEDGMEYEVKGNIIIDFLNRNTQFKEDFKENSDIDITSQTYQIETF